jgi:ferredoxin
VPRLIFEPSGLRVDCMIGESIYEVAWRSQVALTTACGAKATCGLCRVKILRGEELLSPPGEADKKHLGNVYFITKTRLGCQARLIGEGDVIVEPVGARRGKAGGIAPPATGGGGPPKP